MKVRLYRVAPPTIHIINGQAVTVVTFVAKEDRHNAKPQQFYVVSSPNNLQTNRAFSHLLFAESNDELEIRTSISTSDLGGTSLPGFGVRVFEVENISSPVYNT